MYKLYISRGSCSLAPHIVLKELALPHKIIKVNVKDDTYEDENGQSQNYLSINPNGWVPVLQIENDSTISEVGVILQFLAEQKPHSGLFPECDKTASLIKSKTQEWLSFISTELHKSYSPLFNPEVDEKTKGVYRKRLVDRYKYINSVINGEYLQGATMTIADVYLFTVSRWAKSQNVDIENLSALQKVLNNIRAREKVAQALAVEGLK